LRFVCEKEEEVFLQLPSWRPGRYEITNYAQKIRAFSIEQDNKQIPWKKMTKDLWYFKATSEGTFNINYEFHASQMDAGGSWSDDQQLYLNFINCCFELKNRESEKISVRLKLPEEYQVATALPLISKHHYQADNFQHLVDSPLVASASLQHYSYQIEDSSFHLWFQGEIHFDTPSLLEKFAAFTKKQIQAFGGFPAKDYHFIYQLLPYRHYHGVEHQFSTVITFGPANTIGKKENLDELFGVSCHELYHFWNVCRIRPKELLPYDFSKEAYIDTGIVAEGVTTYMGDLYLLKSGYFSLEDYLANMEKQLVREFESFGWQNQSISQSSWDLWLDGYKPGVPEKKVSIYNRGALLSFCLDLMLIDSGSSLEGVMKTMWEDYGKPCRGYSLRDFQNTLSLHLKNKEVVEVFFQKYIYGTEDIWPMLRDQTESLNIKTKSIPHTGILDANCGIKTLPDGTVSKVHPKCPAYQLLMQGDKITFINGKPFEDFNDLTDQTLDLKIDRFGRGVQAQIPYHKTIYYHQYKLIPQDSNDKRSIWMGQTPH
ncbi:M61 family metallopeptidase, partial [Echinicola sediminis]